MVIPSRKSPPSRPAKRKADSPEHTSQKKQMVEPEITTPPRSSPPKGGNVDEIVHITETPTENTMTDVAKAGSVVDITEKVVAAANKVTSSPAKSEFNAGDMALDAAMNMTLTAIKTQIDRLDVSPKGQQRIPHLAGSQLPPYVGNSTVKRVMHGIIIKRDKEHKDKFIRLVNFMKNSKDQKRAEFYREITTRRKQWKTRTYGWLSDEHIRETLLLFRRRSTADPSPYRPRVGFLDHWHAELMKADYNQYVLKPANFKFSVAYLNHFNGTEPSDSPTHKRWWYDIDNLYTVLNVKGDHWLGCDIDFTKNKMFVYDSIPSHAKDEEIIKVCDPIRVMIGAVLDLFVDARDRQKGPPFEKFEIHRKKNIPRNEHPGDCGVYAVKYVECLALDQPFNGLNDKNIQVIRDRLAIDLFEQEFPPDASNAVNFPIPQLNDANV